MEQGSIGYFNYVLTENGYRTVDTGDQLPLWDVELTNTKEGKTMLIKQMVNFLPYEDFALEIWTTVSEVLNGMPHCCYNGKVYWI